MNIIEVCEFVFVCGFLISNEVFKRINEKNVSYFEVFVVNKDFLIFDKF